MIYKFSVSNFYSFKENSEMDLTVNEHAPKTDSYIEVVNNNRITKVGAVFGHNASGKTNLLRVLPFLKWFITSSFNTKPEDEVPFKPFFFNKIEKNNTFFSVVFEISKNIYKYELELTTKKIISEQLSENDKKLFSRSWNKEKNEYIYDLKKYGISKEFENLIRDNVSIISLGAQAKHDLSIRIYKYWEDMTTNIIESGRIATDNNIFGASEVYYKNPELKAKAEKMLSQFDLGLSKIEIQEHKFDEGDNKKVYIPFAKHIYDKESNSFQMPFVYESHGTINLFSLLPRIFNCLDKGSIIILDEFDADLHPQMLPVLIELFISKKHNPKNAQIIFNSHSPQILNELDKYQIYFTEKDKKCSSCVYRLSDIEGVRVDDNYYAKYISGKYGAVPDIDLE
jgi:AAA15 family ATPase/GTPase